MSVDDAQSEGQSMDDAEVRGSRHTSVLVEGGVVEVRNNLLDGRHGAVPVRITCEFLDTAAQDLRPFCFMEGEGEGQSSKGSDGGVKLTS